MDNYITRFGYIIKKDKIEEKELLKLKQELTVTPFKPGNFGKRQKNTSFSLYVENGDYISIPRFYAIDKYGKPNIDKLMSYELKKYNMEYIGKLRPKQEIIIDKVMTGLDTINGGLLIEGCGSGKTNMAIYIACQLKLKTLVIVHKEFLARQFRDRIISFTNIKEIGKIQRNTINIDPPFVIAMVQSLCRRNYDDKIFREFGLIIIDEVHHMGARDFSSVYKKIGAKYMLGISAETERTDKMYKIINWYMGPILHYGDQKPNDMVIVKKILYSTSNIRRSKIIINKYTDEPDRSTMITNLVYIKKRNRLIVSIIEKLYDDGKNILFLTGRLIQVKLIYKMLNKNEYMKNNIGIYIGSIPEKELLKSSTKQIILGTYEMAQEGLDIENLNVVILGTPKSAIKQSVGRILRKEIYEEHPIVIDIVDFNNKIFTNQYKTREKHYIKQRYGIHEAKISDYELENNINWDDNKSITEFLQLKTQEKKEEIVINYSNDLLEFLD